MSKSGSESGSESNAKPRSKTVLLGHEKLDVYRLEIDYVAWSIKRRPTYKAYIVMPEINGFVQASQFHSTLQKEMEKHQKMIEGVISKSQEVPRWNALPFRMFLWLEAPLKKWKVGNIKLNLIV